MYKVIYICHDGKKKLVKIKLPVEHCRAQGQTIQKNRRGKKTRLKKSDETDNKTVILKMM